MVRVVFIRHGDKQRLEQTDERDWPLSENGTVRVRGVAETLSRVDLLPHIYLTSRWEHARQTAEILATERGPEHLSRVVRVGALTPKTEEEKFSITGLLEEASNEGIDLEESQIVALVGHEPRLSMLITQMTAKRVRPLDRLEAVVIKGEGLGDLMRGKGTVECRIPVRDYQEEQLGPKIRSKMTVATFLAGFTFNALIGILRDKDFPLMELKAFDMQSLFAVLPAVAAIFLTAALALFIASVYMLDSMTMPEGFWIGQPRPSFRMAWPQSFRENLNKNGPLYAYMKRTWECVFTPAVLLALVGFGAILVRTKLTAVIISCFIIVAGAFVYYGMARPKLGTD